MVVRGTGEGGPLATNAQSRPLLNDPGLQQVAPEKAASNYGTDSGNRSRNFRRAGVIGTGCSDLVRCAWARIGCNWFALAINSGSSGVPPPQPKKRPGAAAETVDVTGAVQSYLTT